MQLLPRLNIGQQSLSVSVILCSYFTSCHMPDHAVKNLQILKLFFFKWVAENHIPVAWKKKKIKSYWELKIYLGLRTHQGRKWEKKKSMCWSSVQSPKSHSKLWPQFSFLKNLLIVYPFHYMFNNHQLPEYSQWSFVSWCTWSRWWKKKRIGFIKGNVGALGSIHSLWRCSQYSE